MLRFPNVDALHLALTSGIVPTAISLSPAACRREPSGAIGITPNAAVPGSVAEALQQFGIEVVADAPSAETIDHWLQAIPLGRELKPPNLAHQTPVLIEGTESAVGDLSREILRLGNDRQTFRVALSLRERNRLTERDDYNVVQSGSTRSLLLQVLGPPYFSLLRAIQGETAADLCAYLEAAPGVWIEFGWTHPLANQIRPAAGQMILLRPPNQWRTLNAEPFHDIYDALILDAGLPSADWSDAPVNAIDVPLTLSAGNTTDAPELWLLEDNGEERIDAFVLEADRRTIERLTFAVFETPSGHRVLLRSRPHPQGPPTLDVRNALTFRPFQRVPNLFVPCGTAIQPPLSREAVRRLLANDPDRICWLMPLGDGNFTPHSLPETAFQPLSDWVEHVLNLDRSQLEAWVAASTCDFGAWTSADAGRESSVHRRPPPAKKEAIAPTPSDPTVKPATTPRRARRPPAKSADSSTALISQPPSELHAQLRALESQFIDSPGHLESPERQSLWPQLGRLNAALGQTAEASLCWLNALWETPSASSELAWAWVESERALSARAVSEADLARLMPAQPSTTADLRPLAAAIVWGCRQRPMPPVLRARFPAIQDFLSKHDGRLPVRAVWLVWQGMIAAVGGDLLALARIRDRVLDRLLTGGLNPERDLPAFLRFAGTQGGDRLRVVRDRMEILRLAIHRWSGFPPGDGLQQTSAYIDLMFAFANARLGEGGAAQALLSSAAERLDASGNGAHRFLLEAFRWRIDQVLAGKPHAGPLPAEQIEYLEQMRREVQSLKTTDPLLTMPPYVVERMRKESRIVDPHEELYPYRHTNVERDSTIKEIMRLADVHDARALVHGLRRVVAGIQSHSQPEVRLRVLSEAIPLAARVGAAFCSEVLDKVGPTLNSSRQSNDPSAQFHRAQLLERSLLFAALFDRSDLVPALLADLEAAIAEPAPPTVLVARSRMIAESLRSMRKCGLSDEVERLVEILAGSADSVPKPAAGANLEQSLIEVQVAAAWLVCHQWDRARPILENARALIFAPRDSRQSDWLPFVSLIEAYIGAAARLPMEESLQRIEELFTSGKMPRLPNSLTTHAYYSRLHLSIAESVVLALANDEFTLGPAARHWLDDDEYLVRRRIHRDLRAAMSDERGAVH